MWASINDIYISPKRTQVQLFLSKNIEFFETKTVGGLSMCLQ